MQTYIGSLAIAISIVGVVLNIYLAPGYYSLLNFIFSITSIIAIFSFIEEVSKGNRKQYALAAAIAISALPGAGYVLEGAKILDRKDLQMSTATVGWFLIGMEVPECSSDYNAEKGRIPRDEATVREAIQGSDGIYPSRVMFLSCRDSEFQSSTDEGPLALIWLAIFLLLIKRR